MSRQRLCIFPLAPFRFLFWTKRKNKHPCQFVYLSTRLLKKNFFSFFALTPSQMWLKRPVYRGFSGEGKCEGKWFALTLPSHLPSHPRIPTHPHPSGRKHTACRGFHRWASDSMGRARKSSAFPAVQVCCTFGATMLPLWYSYARSFIKVLYCRSTPIGLLQYSYWILQYSLLDYSSTSIGLLQYFYPNL